MATLTIADLDNGKRDLQTVDEVANSRAATATTRFGQQTTTLYEAIRRINATGDEILSNLGFRVPVPYASGLNVTDSRFTVTGPDGKVYAPLSAPFTTGTWDPSHWYVLQNDLNDHKLLIFEALLTAQAAATTLPDGQMIDVLSTQERYRVDAGALVFVERLRSVKSPLPNSVKQDLEAVIFETVDLLSFGALGGGADDTTAIQDWLSQAAPGRKLTAPAGDFIFKEPLSIPAQDGLLFSGAGTALLYDGADTTIDLITIGDGATSFKNLSFTGITIDSLTTMTAGHALRVRRLQKGSNFGNVNIGRSQDSLQLFNGAWFDNINVCFYDGFRIIVQNDGLIVNGSATTDEGSDLFMDRGFILGGVNPVRIAGGFGGVYFGQVLCYGGTGASVRVDQSRANRGNREILLSDGCCLDGASEALIYVNNPGDSLIIQCDAFLSGAGYFSASPGDNINIVSMPNGRLTIGSSHVKSAKRHGILVQDASTVVTISDHTLVTDNAGWGTIPTITTSNIFSNAVYLWNTLGGLHQNALQYQFATSPVSSSSGSIGSATCNFSYQARSGRCFLTADITVTDAGTAGGALIVFLPKRMIQNFVGHGANLTSGKSVSVRGNSSDGTGVSIQNFDGSFPATSGQNIRLTFEYFFSD